MATVTELRGELIDLIEATFQTTDPDETSVFAAIHDGRLPRLMGDDAAYCGVSPESQIPRMGQMNDQEITVLVQFYLKYEKTQPIDPKLVLSPADVEDVVEQFQQAVQEAIGSGSTSGRWYYNITQVQYPPDPVGQKTRAEVTITAHGNNPAIIETTP